MKKLLLGLSVSIFSVTNALAELSSSQLIVKLKDEKSFLEFKESHPRLLSAFKANEQMGIYVIDAGPMMHKKLFLDIKSLPGVEYVQKDYQLQRREYNPIEDLLPPNDERWSQLWNFQNHANDAGINILQAWNEFGVGGLDARGNEVVVAVVDDGLNINHPDLVNNLWVNRHEVAGTGKDDDGNGYVDDVHGFNVPTNNGNLPATRHGTHVAGIVGAEGNNGIGVTGVNWDTKIMGVGVGRMGTVEVLRGYTYVMDQKRLWLETDGELGANIVATNSSFGHDFRDCESGDYPLWNDMYNAKGELGILSAAATMNRNSNVDVAGDVPTGCSSPYIIKVTNTTRENRRNRSAAYGPTTIEIGAPGTAIMSTLSSGYGSLTGTSMATPHVAGLVGLMHSLASEDFNEFYLENPAQAALRVKEMILNNADPVEDLEGMVTSGGKIDVYRSVEAIYNF